MGKLATKQARTLEVEFTLAPRNRTGESSRGANRNNNYADDEFNEYNESTAVVQHAPRAIDAQNEQEFPSLAGTSTNTFSVRPSVSIRTKTFGPGGLARTKENFPALGGGSSDASPVHNNNNGYKMGTASALFKNGNTSKNVNSGMVMIHLSNRPSTSNAPPKKPDINPKSAKDFPSLGRKSNLESDFAPLVPVNHNNISSKHRSIVSQSYESAAAAAPTKVGIVQREKTSAPMNKTLANVPKLNSKDNFPALGNGTEVATTAPWVTAKKQPTESRKAKVAPPPLSTTKVEAKPTIQQSTNKVDVKSNGKVNTKKEKGKQKVVEKKEEPKGKGSKKTESKPLAKNDFDESECVPSQSVLNVVSAKHRSLINGYEPTIHSNSSKLQFVKRDSDISSEKLPATSVPKFSFANNFPALNPNDTKFKETNNNKTISFIDIMKNAKDPTTADTDVSNNQLNNDFSNIATPPPPGFNDKSRKKQTQPPPGFNTVTLNSVVKPTNNLTFTSSLGESYSILPTHRYVPPRNQEKRNIALFAHFQRNEEPEAVEQFKAISKMFIHGSYRAEPYYEHCKFALKDKFDVIFPELLVLLPDISKQQELYLVHSQHEATNIKNRKQTKKNQNLELEVCATCKQVLISSDLSLHLQSHSLENNFPKLGNPDGTSSISNAWKK